MTCPKVAQDKQCRAGYRSRVLRCQEIMGSKEADSGLYGSLHLPLQLFFRKCKIGFRGIDPRVSILTTKLKVSLPTNCVCVEAVSLNLGKEYNHFGGCRRAAAELVSVLCEICIVICLPQGLLCDSEQHRESKYETKRPRFWK